MSYRLGKVLLVAMIGVLGWMIVSAFAARPSSHPSVKHEMTSAPAPEPAAEPRTEKPAEPARPTSNPPGLQSKAEHEAGHSLASSGSPPPPPLLSSAPMRKRAPVDPRQPLPSDGHGRTALNWDVLAATKFGPDSRPIFSPNLTEAAGKVVSLGGFMAPLDEAGDMHLFLLLEFPIGCFYCLVPDPAGIVLVELKGRQTEPMRYDMVAVTGKLRLNFDDPEDFLYIISDAELSPAE